MLALTRLTAHAESHRYYTVAALKPATECDVIVLRVYSVPGWAPQNVGIVQTVYSVVRRDTVRGLWKGTTPVSGGTAHCYTQHVPHAEMLFVSSSAPLLSSHLLPSYHSPSLGAFQALGCTLHPLTH